MKQENKDIPSEEEVVEAFITLGLNDKQARILTYTLRHRDGVTQHDMERQLDLRQPEVSTNLGPLLDKHWVKISDRIRSKDGRSRPVNIYAPAKSSGEIVENLEDAFQKRCNLIQRSFEIIASV